MDPRQSLLLAWADLAAAALPSVPLVAAPREDFLWLGPSGGLFTQGLARSCDLPNSAMARRLAQLDALAPESHVLREGWVFLAGTIERDGSAQPIVLPLLSRSVRLATNAVARTVARQIVTGTPVMSGPPEFRLTADGEAEITELVEDPSVRGDLGDRAEFGRGAFSQMGSNGTIGAADAASMLRRMPALRAWIEEVVAHTGLHGEGRLLLDTQDPWALAGRQPGLRAVVGSAVFATRERQHGVAATALQGWARHRDLDRSCFPLLYPVGEEGPSLDGPSEPASEIDSPFPLSPSQERVVGLARMRPLTVVSGAPGTGKSHTVAAIALDHVARGQSVLIATRSRFAARAIADLIDRVPGPNALRFGDIIDGSSVVDELNDQLLDRQAVDAEAALGDARTARDSHRRTIARSLQLEVDAQRASGPISAMRVLAPKAFEPDADLEHLERLAADASAPPSGWWQARRHRRAIEDLARNVGAPVSDVGAVAEAIERARRRRAALLLDADGGTVIGEGWEQLATSEDQLHLAIGAAARERQDRGRKARGAVAELLAALRAGRGRRRQLLAAIDADALTAAVPLWIGTLGDIEDLLPARAGSFDLVILDEAAHIDQPSAAPALLRSRRAVVVGDPRQLRHVSFLADAAIDLAMAAHGIPELASVVDLRRNTVFDRAAAVAPVIDLAEHYRSVPHLVSFPIAEFYRDRIDIMTRRPDNDDLDVIEVVVPAEPSRAAEVAHVISMLEARLASGTPDSVGVTTPFREHADAIQAAVLGRFSEGEIRALGLRVGTVHGFQGAERDSMILALGITPDDVSKRLGFLENRNLFNVMVTRARNEQVIVTSVTEPREGLLARYLRHSLRAPVPLPDRGTADPWARSLVAELARAGIATHLGYEVGPWVLDLVLDDRDEAIAFETSVATGDPQLHIDRHAALASLGWRFVEAYPSRWDHDVAAAALAIPELIESARRDRLPPPPVVSRVRDLGRSPQAPPSRHG